MPTVKEAQTMLNVKVSLDKERHRVTTKTTQKFKTAAEALNYYRTVVAEVQDAQARDLEAQAAQAAEATTETN